MKSFRSSVVAARVLLLALAATALVVAVVIARAGRGRDDGGPRYVCPMHPEVTAAGPGQQCPICNMALEPVARDPNAGPRPAMGGMVDLTAVENVRKHKILDFVRVHSLLPNLREMRGPAWVEADRTIVAVLYKDQIDELAASEPGTFTLGGAPAVRFAVRRTADPVVSWDRSTARVRFRAQEGAARAATATATGMALEPGQAGWLELARKPRDVLGVPASAILQSPDGPYVLVPRGGGRFDRRPIEIGETFLKQGFAVVLSGLGKHDLVVSRAAFFIDADRRLGNASGEGLLAP